MEIKKIENNLTPQERQALNNMRKSKDIVIKKADKSNTVVIIDTEEYIAESIRQLSTDHYTEIDKPDCDILSIHNVIQNKVKNMYHSQGLTRQRNVSLSH